MAEDYKPMVMARKKSGGGTLLGIFIGLILGLSIAVGIAWYMNKSPMPFVKAKPPDKASAEAGRKDHAAGGETALRVLQDPAWRRGTGD